MEKNVAHLAPINSLVDVYQLIDQLFPFHFIIDAQFNIIQIGKNIKKISPECAINHSVSDYFKLVRPKLNLSFDDFSKKTKETFIFSFSKANISLKGQILFLSLIHI